MWIEQIQYLNTQKTRKKGGKRKEEKGVLYACCIKKNSLYLVICLLTGLRVCVCVYKHISDHALFGVYGSISKAPYHLTYS